jgi:Fic family protein
MNKFKNHKFPPDLSRIYDEKLANQLGNTQGAIGNLNQLSRLLPNANLLMRPILSKEAESSSQLEGTQASIEDAYKIDVVEQSPTRKNNAQEIVNYERAMLTGLEILKKTDFNLLLIREVHKRLMAGSVRGEGKHPGEFRKKPVWIGVPGTDKGKAKYVPPDFVQIPMLMENLVEYSGSGSKQMNPLIACALLHHRFEAVHPFEDGNGRTGRLLISLYLIFRGLLSLPILYPSGFFEKRREEYTKALSLVDAKDEWYVWIMYFLKGMQKQAETSLKIGLQIDSLYKESKQIIEETEGARSLTLLRVLEHLFIKPIVTAPILARDLNIPSRSCKRYLLTLSKHKIITNRGLFKYRGKNQRVYSNDRLFGILRAI